MSNAFVESISLIGFRGSVILLLIAALLIGSILIAVSIRGRYAALRRDLRQNQGKQATFRSRVLNMIVHDTEDALKLYKGDVNSQAIIESHFQSQLKALLAGERFTKASVGLLIILGLVGTFLGLTLSIGKLVTLVSQDLGTEVAAAESLTTGLADSLEGMSIAFSTSLFGILAAIIMTFVNVFVSVTDARNSLIAELEAYLDNTVLAAAKAESGSGLGLDQLITGFGHSVAHLHEAVNRFEVALQTFSQNTRDFNEFNFHLRDNIQRMGVAFSDFTGALHKQANAANQRRG